MVNGKETQFEKRGDRCSFLLSEELTVSFRKMESQLQKKYSIHVSLSNQHTNTITPAYITLQHVQRTLKKMNLHNFCTRLLYSPSYDDEGVSILHHKTTWLFFLNDLGRK